MWSGLFLQLVTSVFRNLFRTFIAHKNKTPSRTDEPGSARPSHVVIMFIVPSTTAKCCATTLTNWGLVTDPSFGARYPDLVITHAVVRWFLEVNQSHRLRLFCLMFFQTKDCDVPDRWCDDSLSVVVFSLEDLGNRSDWGTLWTTGALCFACTLLQDLNKRVMENVLTDTLARRRFRKIPLISPWAHIIQTPF